MPDIAPAAAPSSPSASSPAAEAAPIVAPMPNPAEATAPTEAEALASFDITKYTDSQVADLESGDPERIAKALGGTAKPAEAKPAAEAKPNPSEDDASSDAANLAVLGETLGRVSIKALKPEDRARTVQALDLIRGGMSPPDAFAEAFGIKASAAVPADEVESPPSNSVPVVNQKVAAIEAELAALEAEYDAAEASYDPKANSIMRKITFKEMDLREAKRDAAIDEQRQAVAAEHAKAWEAEQAQSHAKAMDKFSELITDPDANGDDGFLTRCNYEIYLAEQRKDPILAQADWPEKIGQKVFDKFYKGKEVKNPQPELDESPSIPPAPRQSVRLPGSPAGIGTAAGGLSLEAAEAEFAKLPWDQRLDALGKIEAATKRR